MKVTYKIETKLDKEKWSRPHDSEWEYEWSLFNDDLITDDYSEAVTSLKELRVKYEKSENLFDMARVFRLVKVIEEEEVLDV